MGKPTTGNKSRYVNSGPAARSMLIPETKKNEVNPTGLRAHKKERVAR
jgi:hypothetical protein